MKAKWVFLCVGNAPGSEEPCNKCIRLVVLAALNDSCSDLFWQIWCCNVDWRPHWATSLFALTLVKPIRWVKVRSKYLLRNCAPATVNVSTTGATACQRRSTTSAWNVNNHRTMCTISSTARRSQRTWPPEGPLGPTQRGGSVPGRLIDSYGWWQSGEGYNNNSGLSRYLDWTFAQRIAGWLVGWARFTSHWTQFRSFRRRCFNRSDDPTNSVKALKEGG